MGASKAENKLFPGRPNYTGPTAGMFGLLHHDQFAEYSHDVMERVAYVRMHKPPHEVEIRLHHMIYIGDCDAAQKLCALDADYEAQYDPANGEALYADYEAKLATLYADILVYIRAHIPDCAWTGEQFIVVMPFKR